MDKLETRFPVITDAAFDGRFDAGQDMLILCSLSGEIICKGLLTVERDAHAKAKVQSHDATIRGRLDGEIICSGRLIVASTAEVTGTVKAAALVVEEGASIRGTVETVAPGSTIGELTTANPRSASSSRKAASEPAAGDG